MCAFSRGEKKLVRMQKNSIVYRHTGTVVENCVSSLAFVSTVGRVGGLSVSLVRFGATHASIRSTRSAGSTTARFAPVTVHGRASAESKNVSFAPGPVTVVLPRETNG